MVSVILSSCCHTDVYSNVHFSDQFSFNKILDAIKRAWKCQICYHKQVFQSVKSIKAHRKSLSCTFQVIIVMSLTPSQMVNYLKKKSTAFLKSSFVFKTKCSENSLHTAGGNDDAFSWHWRLRILSWMLVFSNILCFVWLMTLAIMVSGVISNYTVYCYSQA